MIEIDYSRFAPEDRERMKTAAFGIEVEHFTQTTVGRYLIARAEAERAGALEDLAEVSADDASAIRELQMVIKRCDSFAQWLADAMMAGENAEAELKTEGDA